jgi:hypothetical protein
MTVQHPSLMLPMSQEFAPPVYSTQEPPDSVKIDQICDSLFLSSSHQQVVKSGYQPDSLLYRQREG